MLYFHLVQLQKFPGLGIVGMMESKTWKIAHVMNTSLVFGGVCSNFPRWELQVQQEITSDVKHKSVCLFPSFCLHAQQIFNSSFILVGLPTDE